MWCHRHMLYDQTCRNCTNRRRWTWKIMYEMIRKQLSQSALLCRHVILEVRPPPLPPFRKMFSACLFLRTQCFNRLVFSRRSPTWRWFCFFLAELTCVLRRMTHRSCAIFLIWSRECKQSYPLISAVWIRFCTIWPIVSVNHRCKQIAW